LKIIVISAHADDAELGVGGTISRHVSNGDEVCLVHVTHSGYNSYDGKVMRKKTTAHQESINASKILGIKHLKFLNYETKYVTLSVDLIEDLNRIIDEFKAELVYTHWDGDINQDHSAISKATLIAARNVPRILMYRSNWYDSALRFDGSFYVDISEHIDNKVNSIKAHKTEYKKYGERWIEFYKSQARMMGIQMGVKYAECFKVIKWLV
jgi:LmbE family N-acetylglucosaminyl deacetylase